MRPAPTVTYTVRRVDGKAEEKTLHALHTLTLPYDEHVDYGKGWWWIAYHGEELAGYAGSQPARTQPNSVYFSRCGVLSGHRGKGLQLRLLSARTRHARTLGALACITTTHENPQSGNNLIRAGFRLYTPESPWGQPGTNYWRLNLPHPNESNHVR